MPTVENQLAVAASIRWALEKANGTFSASEQGPDSLDYQVAPDSASYEQVLFTEFTVAAAATVSLDLRTFTNALGESVTGTSVLAVLFTATGATGKLSIAPGASNGINFWITGTTPAIVVDCGTDGCMILLGNGSAKTIDATHKVIDVSNPGAATITVKVAAFIGT